MQNHDKKYFRRFLIYFYQELVVFVLCLTEKKIFNVNSRQTHIHFVTSGTRWKLARHASLDCVMSLATFPQSIPGHSWEIISAWAHGNVNKDKRQEVSVSSENRPDTHEHEKLCGWCSHNYWTINDLFRRRNLFY